MLTNKVTPLNLPDKNESAGFMNFKFMEESQVLGKNNSNSNSILGSSGDGSRIYKQLVNNFDSNRESNEEDSLAKIERELAESHELKPINIAKDQSLEEKI